jgi:hypothetical protein
MYGMEGRDKVLTDGIPKNVIDLLSLIILC